MRGGRGLVSTGSIDNASIGQADMWTYSCIPSDFENVVSGQKQYKELHKLLVVHGYSNHTARPDTQINIKA